MYVVTLLLFETLLTSPSDTTHRSYVPTEPDSLHPIPPRRIPSQAQHRNVHGFHDHTPSQEKDDRRTLPVAFLFHHPENTQL